MKIAVCVSGACRSGVKNRDFRRNYDNLKICFPDADFYYGAWKGDEAIVEKHFSDQNVTYFDEPEMHYHPFIDIDMDENMGKLNKSISHATSNLAFRERSSHQTKQIIAHCKLINTLPQKYDIIVRCRYDTIVYNGANFEQYINSSYSSQCAIGFAVLKIKTDTNAFTNVQEQCGNDYHRSFLFDQLIIYYNDLLNTAKVFEMHQQKKLIAAEHGWWQVLSGGIRHRCIAGWANPDKSVNTIFL